MTPRLTIGLPVYNGEEYLAESLDALLGQSFEDYELIITDNASTDGTAGICKRYLKADSRISYHRLPRNIGAAGNHNHVFTLASGELFKWASHDDLYGRTLLERCVEFLDDNPDFVLAHSYNATIDSHGKIIEPYDYRIPTDSPSAAERFRGLLHAPGGDDFYGVIRTADLRRVKPHDSYHHADRTFVMDMAMQGRFHQVAELLYFRRDHENRAERANPSIRSRCANLDPKRATGFNPAPRLLAEYALGYVGLIRRAPISAAEKRTCYRHLAEYLSSRVTRKVVSADSRPAVAPKNQVLSIDGIVPRGAHR
ncbi:glycosyltransferase family 2 protein [Actinophytocola algeriensis]|uniref:Glycosyltransferase involved in cell wall biosynthesis n=1 Tax=Actinophytocola algeriensis TaxID=1768010 RepID=A0A7W7Q3J9_9PSEU|nr:glycosyltransferase family 2 protein [Actinophytocola algeriensis]MBB4906294.1 glycosyltransferase involved in cell wall biosynthesis [Actinophytocola algeriensis]MBE1477775.1 glycosyltransferase involved in cell wall biosynthesis [Actinophytocola algeriensis]